MTLFTVPSKDTTETIPVVFPFAGKLQFGETLSAATMSVTLMSGTDANPSAMLSGSPTVSSPNVTQSITGGIAGNVYVVICACTTSASHTYSMECRVAVITPGGLFNVGGL